MVGALAGLAITNVPPTNIAPSRARKNLMRRDLKRRQKAMASVFSHSRLDRLWHTLKTKGRTLGNFNMHRRRLLSRSGIGALAALTLGWALIIWALIESAHTAALVLR